MELFNDYGTFTYKILQTKTKNSPKNKTKIWAHNLQNFHDAGKLCTLLNRLRYISIGLHAETNLDKSQKYGGLDKDVAKRRYFFPLKACGKVPSLD